MANAPIGDLVNFEDDERLDKPDALRLQTLVYETLADVLGGFLGESSGVLGWPSFGTTPTSAITIGECMLVGLRRRSGSSNRVRGGIFHFNPLSTYQAGSTTVDLSAYEAGEGTPYLWFARTEMLADVETRRKFAGGVETSFNPETSVRQRIIFGTSTSQTTPPDEDNDWFIFARVTQWSGAVPTIEPFHPFEPGNLAGAGDTNDAKIAAVLADPGVGNLTTPGVRLSAAEFFDVFRRAILMLFDTDWTFDKDTGEVLTAGTIGIFGGASSILGARQAKESVDFIEVQPAMLLWGRVTFSSGTPTFGVTRRQTPTDADVDNGVGNVSVGIKCTGIPIVSVTPATRVGADFTGDAPTFRVQILAGTGVNDWLINVKLWDNANAAEDVDFHILAFGAVG